MRRSRMSSLASYTSPSAWRLLAEALGLDHGRRGARADCCQAHYCGRIQRFSARTLVVASIISMIALLLLWYLFLPNVCAAFGKAVLFPHSGCVPGIAAAASRNGFSTRSSKATRSLSRRCRCSDHASILNAVQCYGPQMHVDFAASKSLQDVSRCLRNDAWSR